jgi:hypothetical protein
MLKNLAYERERNSSSDDAHSFLSLRDTNSFSDNAHSFLSLRKRNSSSDDAYSFLSLRERETALEMMPFLSLVYIRERNSFRDDALSFLRLRDTNSSSDALSFLSLRERNSSSEEHQPERPMEATADSWSESREPAYPLEVYYNRPEAVTAEDSEQEDSLNLEQTEETIGRCGGKGNKGIF